MEFGISVNRIRTYTPNVYLISYTTSVKIRLTRVFKRFIVKQCTNSNISMPHISNILKFQRHSLRYITYVTQQNLR